ncbi:MAG: CPBP family intramembrane metalloprotease [Labilithrix sp.]|nr:CPBP family intramembrane metalloprotease [Labilithrix sp.]
MSFLGPGRLPPAKELTGLAGFVEDYKALLPIPALAAILVLVWLFFRDTWRELDEDSLRLRAEVHAKGRMDHRPFLALVLIALILTMQEYYGGRLYFDSTISPWLSRFDEKHPGMQLAKYEELYGFVWWAGTRVFGYVLPFALWKVWFRKDSLLDLGLRTKGFFDHAWIYGLFLAFVLPAMLVVAKSPDFGTYYPFYKLSTRSWFDFLVWEAMYFAQFFALEMFFRGFWLGALRRSFGSGAIFVMAVPYCMIHYGKPYLEACGAIVAGIALGSLSMKTKSIYQGFLVHVTVAALMDWLALRHRKATPLHLWPSDLPVGADAWLREQEQREALAQAVERTAAVVFAVLFVFMVVMIVRSRRRRGERFWTLSSPPAKS